MKIASYIYRKIKKKEPPYYYNYSIFEIIAKPIRKWLTVVVAPNSPFNCIRILIYRICGFKIGKKTFIGMKCYLDDLCRKQLIIGNNVTISYGVYFACHGKNQNHSQIIINDGAYIGMRSIILSHNSKINGGGGLLLEKNL